MKTTDGYDLGLPAQNYFYTVNGECVLLEDAMQLSSGEYKYLVRYNYEGTSMDVKCYGDGPVEINYPFEIEGEPTIINKLFKNPPTPKKSKEFVEGKLELEKLKEELHYSRNTKNELEKNTASATQELDKLTASIAGITSSIPVLQERKKTLESECEKIQKLVDHLEVLAKLKGENLDKELIRLRKRDEKLTCLENGGVNNWEWYSESLEKYNDD